MLVNKDATRIGSVLYFLSTRLDKFKDEQNRDDYQETKENLGIEINKRDLKVMFYNIECKRLDNKSLLKYIDTQHFTRQREELIDLSVKIADLNHGDDTAKAMKEVINHYKSGLHSGVGLRDMISLIKGYYPWSSFKKMMMILFSLISCLLGIGLFVLDLYTDVEFTQMMFSKTFSPQTTTTTTTFITTTTPTNTTCVTATENYFTFATPESCYAACNAFMKENFTNNTVFEDNFTAMMPSNQREQNLREAEEDYGVIWTFSIWHCIQPFVAIMIVFLSMNCRGYKEAQRSFREIPDPPNCADDVLYPTPYRKLNSFLCGILRVFSALWYLVLFVGSVVPLPGLTHLYRFYLDVRSHIKRSKPDFRTKIVGIEEEIRKHEALGKLLKSSENFITLKLFLNR